MSGKDRASMHLPESTREKTNSLRAISPNTVFLMACMYHAGGMASAKELCGLSSNYKGKKSIAEMKQDGLAIEYRSADNYILTNKGRALLGHAPLEELDEIEAEILGAIQPDGYIYFIRSDNLVKIGYSTNPVDRLHTLQIGSPVELTLVAAFPAHMEEEREIHALLQEFREHGEWFTWCEPIEKMIETHSLSAEKNFFPTTTALTEIFNQKNLRTEEADKKNFLTAEQEASWSLLASAGIGDPTRTNLAKQHPPEYIAGHIEAARKEKIKTGLLIHRMRAGDPVPEKPADPDDASRYRDGDYAKYIRN